MDRAMSGPEFAEYRKQVLGEAQGEVLEIGFGTGLNLAYYPRTVQKISTVDPNPGMNSLALKKIKASHIQVEQHIMSSEQLPFADGSFDTIVSTWTLCSIGKVEQALREMRRVLKPEGRFLFIEHGLSPDPKVQVWQHRLTPLQKKLADGCHFDRNIKQLIEQQGFHFQSLKEFYVEGFPKYSGYMYQGSATRQ
jgi:ubiquinone/menaquinone biosynthesis C-methylase UbiE